MTTLKKYQYLSCLILASCCAIANSQEPDPNTQKLQFEISKFDISKILPKRLSYEILSNEITHLALIELQGDRKFSDQQGGRPRQYKPLPIDKILNTDAGKAISEKQRSLLHWTSPQNKTALAMLSKRDSDNIEDIDRDTIARFYINALSEDDARKTTEALIEYFNKQAQSEINSAKKNIEWIQETIIPPLEKEIAELEKEYQSLNESQINKILEDCWQRKYDLVSEENLSQDLAKTMKEIEDKLRLLDYDSSNREAKKRTIDHIKQAGKVTDQNILAKLDDLLITYEIELAGLVREKEVVRDSLSREAMVADALHKIKRKRELPSLIDKANADLTSSRERVSYLETQLAYPPAEWKPVEVIDNKVTIYQLPPKQPPTDSPDSQPTSPQP